MKKFKDKTSKIFLKYEERNLTIVVDLKKTDTFELPQLLSGVTHRSCDLSPNTFKEIKVLEKEDKISLFCLFYKHYRTIDYTQLKTDAKDLKDVPVTRELLKSYFEATEWWCKVKNVKNYCHNINNIKELKLNIKTKPQFPNEYDKGFESKLEPKELQDYWRHLNSLGWKRVNQRWTKLP